MGRDRLTSKRTWKRPAWDGNSGFQRRAGASLVLPPLQSHREAAGTKVVALVKTFTDDPPRGAGGDAQAVVVPSNDAEDSQWEPAVSTGGT